MNVFALRPRTTPVLSLAIAGILLVGCWSGPAATTSAPPIPSSSSPSPTPAASAIPNEDLATGAPRAGAVEAPPSPEPPRTDRSGFLVALDPGHGGDESGAAANEVIERNSNLDLARRVGGYLEAAGVQVYYTRTDEGRAPDMAPTTGGNATRDDLQARTSAANRVGADIFLSLHSNGSADTSLRGFEVYYESRRPFAEQNLRLATEVLAGALRGAEAAGHPSTDRGAIDAACWRSRNGRCFGLFVLSPGGATASRSGAPSTRVKEATNMPAALLESLFISNPEDAALLRDAAVRDSIARGIADGILRYLGVLA